MVTTTLSLLIALGAVLLVMGWAQPELWVHLLQGGWLGLLNLLLGCLWLTLLIAPIAVTQADLHQLMPVLLQIGFLSSPILFYRQSLGSLSWVAQLNPFMPGCAWLVIPSSASPTGVCRAWSAPARSCWCLRCLIVSTAAAWRSSGGFDPLALAGVSDHRWPQVVHQLLRVHQGRGSTRHQQRIQHLPVIALQQPALQEGAAIQQQRDSPVMRRRKEVKRAHPRGQ